jgi:hypothetical protein
MYESWFWTTPDISGLFGSIRFISFVFGSPTNSFMNSGSMSRTVSTVWVVRNPSWTLKNGVYVASATRREMRQKSPASWALRAKSIPHPTSATLITSSWPAWTLSPWLVSARAPMFMTTGSRLPLIV